MKQHLYISIVFVLMQSFALAQFNKYCNYTQVAVEKYSDKKLDLAKQYIDSALLLCPELETDAYTHHVKGFILYELFRTTENENFNSKLRETALESFVKSKSLDTKDEYLKNNTTLIRNIANSYQRNCVALLKDSNVESAKLFNKKYQEVLQYINTNESLIKWDISFNNTIADIYWGYYQDDENANEIYFNKAIDQYNEVLKIDSLDHHALYTLGVIYFNKGLKFVLDLNDDADLLEVLDAQEKQVEYALIALPYLRKAYTLKPKNKETLIGLSSIYYMLNENDKHQFYQNLSKELGDDSEQD